MLPLLEHAPELTRLRAQRVLEAVTLAWVHGRGIGQRPLTRSDTREWQELWTANGAYDWRGTPEQRRKSVARWRAWLSEQRRQDPPPG